MGSISATDKQQDDATMLDGLLNETFTFFTKHVNPKNGLIADKTQPGSACSIAVIGLGLCCYIVAVKRGLLTRSEAAEKSRKVLQFLYEGQQGTERDAMGYKGFFYHFLDMNSGKRAAGCELSTIDTAFLMAGILTAAYYFTTNNENETRIRTLADQLYRRVDWQWMLNGGNTICHGWKPGSGFLRYRWEGRYNEALLLYIVALGSPTFPIPAKGYEAWISSFKWKKIYGIEHFYAGPLFIHQLSFIWIDCRGIMDAANKRHGIDYFENSRRATYVQREYAIRNPRRFPHYNKNCWGLTASDGPGPARRRVNGIPRIFFDYAARGAPFGPDDGTVSPWAVVASLPFAPEIVMEATRHMIERLSLRSPDWDGLEASFNPTFTGKSRNPNGWVSPWKFGLNQGPVILMIENYASGLIWNIMKACPYIITGLKHAGFRGGWLDT